MLLSLTLLPLASLIVIPVLQRASFQAYPWQGQVTQASLWALLPLGVLWTLQMFDSGSGVLSLVPSICGLGLLLFGSSGGWPALLSGRLAQGAVLLIGLLAFYLGQGVKGVVSGLCLLILAAVADSLLERLGPAPREPREIGFSELPLESPELSGTLVGARAEIEELPVEPQVESATSVAWPRQLSDRPPLPPPGMVSRWAADQAEAAAQGAQQTGDEFKRSRRLNR